jgi:hypothetical protein
MARVEQVTTTGHASGFGSLFHVAAPIGVQRGRQRVARSLRLPQAVRYRAASALAGLPPPSRSVSVCPVSGVVPASSPRLGRRLGVGLCGHAAVPPVSVLAASI